MDMNRRFILNTSVIMLLCIALFASGAYAFPANEVYKKAAPGVVLIAASSGEKGGSKIGAGSFVTRDGYIITNAHVIFDDDSKRPLSDISVFVKPNELTGDLQEDLKQSLEAKVVAVDRDLDLALLKVANPPADIQVLNLADPNQIEVGEEVVAIGHPEQGGLWSLTYGRISGQISNQNKVQGKDMFQTDTSVNRGNSGGPLLDKRSYIVGVNTNIARRAADNLAITGVNFALKASVVRTWAQKNAGLKLAYGTEPIQQPAPVVVPERPAPSQPAEPVKQAAPAAPAPSEQPAALKPMKAEPAAPAEPAKPEPAPSPEAKKPYTPPPAPPEPRAETKKEPDIKSGTILTPKRPYSHEDLIKQVEKDLEDMMEDMRMEIDSHKSQKSKPKGRTIY